MAKRLFERSTLFPGWVRDAIGDNKYLEFSYKNNRGHIRIDMYRLITEFNQTEFKKLISIMENNDNPPIIAGYLNATLKRVYEKFKAFNDTIRPKKPSGDEYVNEILKYLEKRNDLLVKAFNVQPFNTVEVVDTVEVIDTVEANENITELKKCNVVRLVPTQVKPIWDNAKLETHIGYNFSYRGLPLQVYRMDGWENKNSSASRIFIIDPVIGLPITNYEGMLSELEEKISEVFFKYLETIESNKESIVQIANAFKELKAA